MKFYNHSSPTDINNLLWLLLMVKLELLPINLRMILPKVFLSLEKKMKCHDLCKNRTIKTIILNIEVSLKIYLYYCLSNFLFMNILEETLLKKWSKLKNICWRLSILNILIRWPKEKMNMEFILNHLKWSECSKMYYLYIYIYRTLDNFASKDLDI